MRMELKNSGFNLETQLEEIQEVAKSYSPPEILKEMHKQNAEVGELVNKLGLSFN